MRDACPSATAGASAPARAPAPAGPRGSSLVTPPSLFVPSGPTPAAAHTWPGSHFLVRPIALQWAGRHVAPPLGVEGQAQLRLLVPSRRERTHLYSPEIRAGEGDPRLRQVRKTSSRVQSRRPPGRGVTRSSGCVATAGSAWRAQSCLGPRRAHAPSP